MPIDKSKTIISLADISFSYGDNTVLRNINLDIKSGDYVGIIGPNGGGKTTLLKLILGILKPDRGTISILGRPLDKFSEWSKIGYVAQRAISFDPKFPVTVFDVVSMGLVSSVGPFHSFTQEDRKLIESALAAVQMTSHKHKLIGALSGGQQQRVFIARAIVSSPEIIFLDEPTSGVDLLSQEEFYRILKSLNQDLGITLVLVSHDVDAVSSEVNELLCINQSLVYHGSPKGFSEGKHLEELYSKGVKFIVHRH